MRRKGKRPAAWHPLAAWEARLDALGEEASGPDLAVLGWLRVQFGPDDRALERDAAAFRQASARDPTVAEWHHGLGVALGSDENARRAAYEEAARRAEHVPSLEALVRHYRRRREPEKARPWVTRLAAVDPEHPVVTLEEARRLEELGAPVAALRLVRAARERRPDVPAFHRREAELLGDLQDRRGQLEALRRYLLVEANSGSEIREMSELMADGLGDAATAIELRRVLLRFWPWLKSDRMWMARLMGNNGREDEALAELSTLAEAFPGDAAVREARGRLLHRLGRTEEGLAALQRSLELRPNNRDLRRYLEHLRPEQGSLADRWAVDVDEVLREGPPPGGVEVGAWTALRAEAIRVHDNGLTSKFVQDVLRVESRTQLDGLSAYPVWYVPGREVVEVLLAERITSDGERHKPTRVTTQGPFGKSQGMYLSNKVRRVEFSDLAPGDAIHVRYRVDEVGRRNLFGDFFGEIRNLQGAIPRRRLVQGVEMPAGRRLYHGGRGAGEPKVALPW